MTRFYNAWCDNCVRYTTHEIIDDPDIKTQVVKCLECQTDFEESILHERVKVLKFFRDVYEERKK